MALKAHEYQLKDIFSTKFDFVIPYYQRPYAWETTQALQLLDDLEAAVDRAGNDPYFLGSLVLIQEDDEKPQVDVVDGQQRLTTLTLLLSVLRELATEPLTISTLDAMVREPGIPLDNVPPKPRVRLREQDAEFFAKYVQTPGAIIDLLRLPDHDTKTDSQKAIRGNAKALHTRLIEWDQSRRDRLATLARNDTYLVVVTTPNIVSAHRIFSVMNDRGLDLEPSDIFKADIVGEIPEPAAASYSKKWEDAEQSLGRGAFGDLFLHLRVIIAKSRLTQNLLTEFPEQVAKPYLKKKTPAEFVDELLLPYADAYGHLLNQDYDPHDPQWAKVNGSLFTLMRLDNADWRPPALWALNMHKDDPDFLVDFLRKLERLAASSLLRREYTTPRQLRYIQLLEQVANGDGLAASAFDLSPDEITEFKQKIDGDIYGVRTVDRYVLLRLDALLGDNPGVVYDHKIISIEHVLPQNPKDDSQWLKDFTEEQRLMWTHRLGNLLLLNKRKNSEAGRRDFAMKKAGYFLSENGVAAFNLTSQVLAEGEWTPTVLDARQKTLTMKLYDLWELN